MYHAGPLVYTVIAPRSGAEAGLRDTWPTADPLRLGDRYRTGHSRSGHAVFHRMAQLPGEPCARHDVSSVVQIRQGVAPCSTSFMWAVSGWWTSVVGEFHAATARTDSSVSSEDWLRTWGTADCAEAGHVRLRHSTGAEVPPRTTGRVLLRALEADRISCFGSPNKTVGSNDGDYETAGNIGLLDEDGYLFVIGWSAEAIIKGAVDTYPGEMAQRLTHLEVVDAAVIGVPDPDRSESVPPSWSPPPAWARGVVESLIDPAAPGSPTTGAPARRPRRPAAPRTETGKVEERRLRAGHRRLVAEGARA